MRDANHTRVFTRRTNNDSSKFSGRNAGRHAAAMLIQYINHAGGGRDCQPARIRRPRHVPPPKAPISAGWNVPCGHLIIPLKPGSPRPQENASLGEDSNVLPARRGRDRVRGSVVEMALDSGGYREVAQAAACTPQRPPRKDPRHLSIRYCWTLRLLGTRVELCVHCDLVEDTPIRSHRRHLGCG